MEDSYIFNFIFNAFTSFTAIMLNSLTIHAMRKTSSLPKPFKTLLLSLAVSDLAVGFLAQPLYIMLLFTWSKHNTDSTFTSTLLLVIVCALSTVSFLSVMALSVDRFLAVQLHLRYQELVTHKRVVAAVISTWVTSALVSTIWIWREAHTAFSIVASIWSLCFICITIVNCRMYFAVRHHTNQIQALQVQQVAQNGEMENSARLRKSVLSIFYVYIVFLVCYLPMYCSIVLLVISGEVDDFLLYSRTVMLFNSSLNPVIYCWKIRHIRHAIMDILRNIFPSHN